MPTATVERCLTEHDFPKESAEHIAAIKKYHQKIDELELAESLNDQDSIKTLGEEVLMLGQLMLQKRLIILRLIGDFPED